MTKTIPALAAIAVAAALLVPTVSQAASADAMTVSYADLNLRGQAGRDTLVRRINFAASSVCAVRQATDLAALGAASDCQDGAIARAQPAFDAAVRAALNPTVTVSSAAALIVTGQ
ncbi:UrcA family protein [Sphingomonas lutea]|uniref:UrcA family protein n=1 Tax=Sphingomonas lutea TaxID=1045317 RepID=A0A7G9SKC0_9SPHN|nr:UrcA family protein [Sphingomonas lutea]QNN68295.1 UrcA family protein [Sphingomonas lutea]